jgi:hypothetical protein
MNKNEHDAKEFLMKRFLIGQICCATILGGFSLQGFSSEIPCASDAAQIIRDTFPGALEYKLVKVEEVHSKLSYFYYDIKMSKKLILNTRMDMESYLRDPGNGASAVRDCYSNHIEYTKPL